MNYLRSVWRWLMTPLACLAFAISLPASDVHTADFSVAPRIIDVPPWILRGIAAVESSSYYRDGVLVYVDRHDGAAGEVGAFQLRSIALRQIGLQRMRSIIRRDPVAAEFAAIVYLRHCYRQAGSWRGAIAIYHTGPDGDAEEGADYFRRVSAAGAPKF